VLVLLLQGLNGVVKLEQNGPRELAEALQTLFGEVAFFAATLN